MRTLSNFRKGVACNAPTLAGIALALTFSLSSCSSSDDGNTPGGGLQVQCPEGSTWNTSALACVSTPVAGSGCPANTTLTLDAENNPICVWEAVENSSSSTGTTTGSIWYTYTDVEDNGGSSTISLKENAIGTITLSGNLTKISAKDDYGFAGWATNDAATIAQAKAATSISFGIKGDGKVYTLQLHTTDILDYDYYATTFKTTSAMKTVTLCLSDFKQAGWGAAKSGLDKSKITALEWQARTNDGILGAFEVTMNGLSFGTGACTSTETAVNEKVYADYGPKWIQNGQEAGGCYETDAAGKAKCEGDDAEYCRVVSQCPANSLTFTNAYCVWESDGGCAPIGGFNMPNNADCTSNYGTVQTSCIGGTTTGGTDIGPKPAVNTCPAGKSCCDWGYPNSGGPGECWPIENDLTAAGCVESTGKVVTTCGIRGEEYCYYGPYKGKDDGGCWMINSATDRVNCEQWGEIVEWCPQASLCKDSAGKVISCIEE